MSRHAISSTSHSQALRAANDSPYGAATIGPETTADDDVLARLDTLARDVAFAARCLEVLTACHDDEQSIHEEVAALAQAAARLQEGVMQARAAH